MIAIAALILSVAQTAKVASTAIAFTHVAIIPMDRATETILTDQTVVTSQRNITQIGPSSRIPLPNGTTVIDGKGKYLIPGLIDMNVRILSAQELPLYVANGVTTVFNQDGQFAHLKWRNAVARGEMTGPNILTTGPATYAYKNEADARQVVINQAKTGFDGVYIQPTTAPGVLTSMVSTSRQRGMLNVGQMPRGCSLDDVLRSRMMISHAEEFLSNSLNQPADMKAALNQTAKQTAAAQAPVIATLVTYTHILRQATDLKSFLARTPTQYLAPWQRDAWQAGTNEYQFRFAKRDAISTLQNGLEVQKDLIRLIHRLGGVVLVGTDANNTGVVPGFSIIEEIQNLQKLGFSNYQALRAASADSAVRLSLNKQFGSIAVGKRADLVLLNSNPIADLSTLSNPAGVMVNGRWNSRETLKKNLNAIPSQYAALLQKGVNAMNNGPDALDAFVKDNDPQRQMTNPLFMQLVATKGEAGLSKFLNAVSAKNPTSRLASENAVNNIGYWLMNTKKQAGLAVHVFQVNLARHPKSANMYDSLGEGYLTMGNKPKAIELYRRAVQISPGFSNSVMMLKRLGATLK